MRILKSVRTVNATGMFSLMEGNDINLIATVISVTEGYEVTDGCVPED